jgi:hypothetical protein
LNRPAEGAPETQEEAGGFGYHPAMPCRTQVAAAELEKLRRWRARRAFDMSIGPEVELAASTAARTSRRLAGLIEAWEAVVPPEIAAHSRINGLRGGTAQVTVDSAAIRYELDRHLRCGGEAELRRQFGATLVRVRLSIGAIESGEPRVA